jgi:hypothetical protein
VSERPKRKAIPLAAQLEAALRQLGDFLGCEWTDMDLDHSPALELRPVENGQHVPHQHDPRHLYWMVRKDHKLKTNGRRGESDLSLDPNSDKARIAKAKRLEKARAEMLSVESRVERGERKKPKSQWPQGRKLQSRGFAKKKPQR